MFWQFPVSIDLDSPLHCGVMHNMVQHVREMQRVEERWHGFRDVPPPNDKLNGGYGGNALDPYFLVLTGEVMLSDDSMFKNREDMYNAAPE